MSLLAGCSTWRPQSLPAADAAALPPGSRVTLADGRVLVLDRAVVRGDSVVWSDGAPATRRAVAARDVVRVERRAVSAPRTLGAVWLGLNAAMLVVALALYAG